MRSGEWHRRANCKGARIEIKAGPCNIRTEAKIRLQSVVLTCKVVQQPHQRPWVALPDVLWTDENGTRRWRRIVEVDDDVWLKARILVLKEYDEQRQFRDDFKLEG